MQVYCSQLFSAEGQSPFGLHSDSGHPSRPARPARRRKTDTAEDVEIITPATYARALHDWTANQLCAATRAMNRNSQPDTPVSYSKALSSPSTLAERRLDVSMAKLTLEPDPRARPGRLFSDHPGESPRRGAGEGRELGAGRGSQRV
ncbi:hypothetical protein W97_04060 [Coniosporium apollinis CBS 100218]|uniref:Uncharacterized protein n=1 Tax=Coniosporium apollinis (strain CBS 100218) TaxID=1168221 RepID=R7YT31_CONA1|nr:uncharacterized protein W97_04060 [Coniosporium apollinis CBS 100218]EON64826.1 hypothetical protein W97_04060 [Coniosporium apollinis CBS 100218]